jgi:CO/xanthine dehydrogenase Mo-binding subunit
MPVMVDIAPVEVILLEIANVKNPYNVTGVAEPHITSPPAAIAKTIHAPLSFGYLSCPHDSGEDI